MRQSSPQVKMETKVYKSENMHLRFAREVRTPNYEVSVLSLLLLRFARMPR